MPSTFMWYIGQLIKRPQFWYIHCSEIHLLRQQNKFLHPLILLPGLVWAWLLRKTFWCWRHSGTLLRIVGTTGRLLCSWQSRWKTRSCGSATSSGRGRSPRPGPHPSMLAWTSGLWFSTTLGWRSRCGLTRATRSLASTAWLPSSTPLSRTAGYPGSWNYPPCFCFRLWLPLCCPPWIHLSPPIRANHQTRPHFRYFIFRYLNLIHLFLHPHRLLFSFSHLFWLIFPISFHHVI